MKSFLLIVLFFTSSITSNSQILKKIANDVKNQAEWKVRSKAAQKTDQAIDSLLTPKKETEKKKENKTSNPQPQKQTATVKASQTEQADTSMGEGFIKLSLSATEVFRGGTIVITGTSVKYGSLDKVKMTITGEDLNIEKDLKMYENGSFAAGWEAEQAGEFTITVKSSDGKDQRSTKVTVYNIDVMDDLWVQDNIEITRKSYDKFKQEAERVKAGIGAKDKAELDNKISEVKKNVDMVLNLFTGLETAANKLAAVAGNNPLPPDLSDNLSELNDQLTKQRKEMQQVYDAANHQPYDNTICEYLVMLNEALAAFSTVTNVWSKSISTILKNIASDKAIPKQVEVINQTTVQAGPTTEFIEKESAKIFVTLSDDATALSSVVAKAGIAGDVAQFITEQLLKTYCGIFKGELTHHYTITYRNQNKITWWEYSYDTKAVVTFRYPKNNPGSVIKMKGTIEGNAVSFKFKQDVEQKDDFKEQMKDKTKLHAIEVLRPIAVPFSTSQADILGFGAIARGAATPSYFNIPVDAEYNTDAQSIKLMINEPIIDFGPAVIYIYVFVGFPLGIPIVTKVPFPINKVKLTLNAVVYYNNELKVTKDAKNNLVVKGSGERNIGSASSEIEHKISYTLTAKNAD